MSMIQIHSDALNSSNPAYHEFLLFYKEKDKVVYGFVEGKGDPSFYRSMIEHNLLNGWKVKLIRSGNKSNVYKIESDFDWTRFSARRICFFVDRDLSEFVPHAYQPKQNIYVTDKYSIENDVISYSMLERVLEEVMNVTEMKPDECDEMQKHFEQNLEIFSEAMVPIMCQIIKWQREGSRPTLEDIQPKEMFVFTDDKIALKAGFATSDSRIAYAGSCCRLQYESCDGVSEIEKEFRDKAGSAKYIRGKYLMWFFVQYALSVHKSIAKFCEKYKSPPRMKASLGHSNALVILGPRARIPDSLKAFINQNYIQYVHQLV